MPLSMTASPGALLQAAADELYTRHVNALLDGVAAALKRGYCHFDDGAGLPPKHKDEVTLSLGWHVPEKFKPPTPRGRRIGYTKATNVYVNLSAGVEVATQAIPALSLSAENVKKKRSPVVENGVEFVKFDRGDILKRVGS